MVLGHSLTGIRIKKKSSGEGYSLTHSLTLARTHAHTCTQNTYPMSLISLHFSGGTTNHLLYGEKDEESEEVEIARASSVLVLVDTATGKPFLHKRDAHNDTSVPTADKITTTSLDATYPVSQYMKRLTRLVAKRYAKDHNVEFSNRGTYAKLSKTQMRGAMTRVGLPSMAMAMPWNQTSIITTVDVDSEGLLCQDACIRILENHRFAATLDGGLYLCCCTCVRSYFHFHFCFFFFIFIFIFVQYTFLLLLFLLIYVYC